MSLPNTTDADDQFALDQEPGMTPDGSQARKPAGRRVPRSSSVDCHLSEAELEYFDDLLDRPRAEEFAQVWIGRRVLWKNVIAFVTKFFIQMRAQPPIATIGTHPSPKNRFRLRLPDASMSPNSTSPRSDGLIGTLCDMRGMVST
jgi:hypothetical protein